MKSTRTTLAAIFSLAASSTLWAAPTQIAQESFEGSGGDWLHHVGAGVHRNRRLHHGLLFGHSEQRHQDRAAPDSRVAQAEQKFSWPRTCDTSRTSPSIAVAAQQSRYHQPRQYRRQNQQPGPHLMAARAEALTAHSANMRISPMPRHRSTSSGRGQHR